MAAKRKQSASAGRGGRKKSAAQAQRNDYRSFVLFAVGLVLLALSFVQGESFIAVLQSNVIFGVFGIGGWLVGPFFIYLAIMAGTGRAIGTAVAKGIFILAAIAGLMMVFGPRDYTGYAFAEVVPALLEMGKSTRFGSGVLSVVLGWTLWAIGGRAVARVLMVVITLLAIMVITSVAPVDIDRKSVV